MTAKRRTFACCIIIAGIVGVAVFGDIYRAHADSYVPTTIMLVSAALPLWIMMQNTIENLETKIDDLKRELEEMKGETRG